MNIVVLAGGLSPERNVSLSSGTSALNALISSGHRAILVDLFFGRPDWDPATDPFAEAKALPPYRVPKAAPDLNAIAKTRVGGYNAFVGDKVLELCKLADVVYMALHGDCGENGAIQALFDEHGIRYTGTGAKGCAQAMDKWLTKQIFRKHGIPTPDGVLLHRDAPIPHETLPMPCVVKPCCGGSSIGVSIVKDPADLDRALALAFSVEPTVLVENYIQGRELSCGILGDQKLPLIEIIPYEGFYDYQNKYQANGAREITPAEVPAPLTEKIQSIAYRGFLALELSVYARLDFLLTASGEVYCLEANTLPGMTPTSLLPQEAQAAGIPYAELCDRIIRLSLEK